MKKFHFITDVEGDYANFKRQIKGSNIVSFADEMHTRLVFQSNNEDEVLVFGGDVCDRGDDISIIKLLIDLKNAHPNRVVLIVGNRDANKTRFANELPLNPNERFGHTPDDVIKPPFASTSYAEFLGKNEDTPVNRLKWILKCTMGAPNAFEFRRNELARLQNTTLDKVTDEMVYNSFRESVEHGGFMHEYLSLCQLAAVIGDTLIVHGGVSAKSMGVIPKGFGAFSKKKTEPLTKQEMITVDSVEAWVSGLNAWYKQAIDRWNHLSPTTPVECQFSNTAPASPLQHIAAGFGSVFHGKTPVVDNFLKDRKSPCPVSTAVEEFLLQNGIHRVLSGHQPHGDTPLLLRGSTEQPLVDTSIQVITCDTLYGNKDAYDPVIGNQVRLNDPRGSSIAWVHVNCEESKSSVEIKGRDGFHREYTFTLAYPAAPNTDRFIGRTYSVDGVDYTVRLNSVIQDADEYLVSYVEGPFSVRYKVVTRDELIQYEVNGHFHTECGDITALPVCAQ